MKWKGGNGMPTILLTPIGATIISQLQPNKSFGPQENLFVGRSSTPNDVFRSLLDFDISAIPTGSIITNATLRLIFFQKIAPGIQPLRAQGLLSDFLQSTVTWNTQPASGGYVYETNLGDNLVGNYIYLDLTGLVQNWYTGAFFNNGILLTTFENQTSLMGFRGYDDGIIPNWPTLIIEYINATPEITIAPLANRYYYIVEFDLTSPDPIDIPANIFKDDLGDFTDGFSGLGPNSYNNLFINGILQIEKTYSVSSNLMTLNTEGTTIYKGAPITLEIVQFSALVSYQ
jgi:hypothetical protein